MAKVFKTFRTDIRLFFNVVGQSQSFRVTGDCTPGYIYEKNFTEQ